MAFKYLCIGNGSDLTFTLWDSLSAIAVGGYKTDMIWTPTYR